MYEDPPPDHRTASRLHSQTFLSDDTQIGLKITLFSSSPSRDVTPLYHNEASITGTVEFRLHGRQTVQSVTVKVIGRVQRRRWDSVLPPFMVLQTEVWSEADARQLQPGTHTRHFAITLPREVTVDMKGSGPETLPLPPTFVQQGFPEFVVYEVQCFVKRSVFARDETLRTGIKYQPHVEAPMPSIPRLLAYENGTPIPGPTIDPDGWASTAIKLCGKLFGKRDVDAELTLSLATPTSYPRGYPLPFSISFTSDDITLLDLLAATSPRNMRVSITRSFLIFGNYEYQDLKPTVVSRGRYWTDTASSVNERRVSGEIPVPVHLKASFKFSRLTLVYAINLAIEAPGLALEGPSDISIPVEIVTDPSPGPLPRSYAPPANPGEEELVYTQPDLMSGRV